MEEEIISLNAKKRCEQYLTSNNIIFKKNIVFAQNKIELTKFDFIFPGGAIIIRNDYVTNNLSNGIIKIHKNMPNNIISYVYLENLTYYDNYKNIFVNYSSNIKIINSFIEIKKQPIYYF